MASNQLMPNAPDTLRSELGPSERIIWSGQPQQGVQFHWIDLFQVPFGLFFAGFAVFWMSLASMGEGGPIFALFGLPFLAIGLYVAVGRFFVEAKQCQRTHYTLTEERIIITSGLFSRSVKSLDLATLSDITLSQKKNGKGTISFGSDNPFASFFEAMPSWPGASLYLGPRLTRIEDAREVYNKIRKAKRSATQEAI